MNSFTIKLNNMTEGFRARNILRRYGIASTIQRFHGRSGCSFRLKISAAEQYACPLLKKAGIDCDIS